MSRITGPTHNLLGLRFAEKESRPTVLDLSSDVERAQLSGEEVLKYAREGVEEANTSLGTSYCVNVVEFCSDDSPPPMMYKGLAKVIVERLARGGRYESPTTIETLIELLASSGIALQSELRPCDARDVEEVEKDAGVPLPRVYKEFLLAMGRGAGRLFQGTDVFFPVRQGLTENARELLKEDPKAPVLPEDAVVFSMHQGYQFMFIRASEGDDPPVFCYMEKAPAFKRISASLGSYLLKCAEERWNAK